MDEVVQTNYQAIYMFLMAVAISTFVILMIFQSLSVGQAEVETFRVTDPSVDQICTLTNSPDTSTIVVEQYTGTAWETITAANYNVAGRVVTVDDAALYG